MRQLVRSPRLVLSVACVLAGRRRRHDRRRTLVERDGRRRHRLPRQPDARAAAAGGVSRSSPTSGRTGTSSPPRRFPRNGLTVKDMTEAQRGLAHNLMKAGLSQRGYMTATSIMQLEDVLGALEQRDRDGGRQAEGFRRDPVRYFFSVFGTPSKKQHVGLARGRAPRVAALHDGQRHIGRELAGRSSDRTRPKCWTVRARARASWRRKKTRRARC